MKSYLITPPYGADRLTDLSQQEAIRRVWDFAPDSPEMHGTLAFTSIRYDPTNHRFGYVTELWTAMDWLSTGSVMSSANMLYRLLCVFGFPPLMAPPDEQYKVLWDYPLQHRATGEFLTLKDYKAWWSLDTRYADPADLQETAPTFAADLLTLLSFLVSDQVSHPYDHTLAGSVA